MGTKRTPSEQGKFNRCVDIMAKMILIHDANKPKIETEAVKVATAKD